MALFLHWYDCFILSIIVGACLTSIWTIRKSERRGTPRSSTQYESLLEVAARNGRAELAAASESSGHVIADRLWMSCWSGVHPAWLLLFRFIVVLTMAGILSSDIFAYNFSIFMYYTEYVNDSSH